MAELEAFREALDGVARGAWLRMLDEALDEIPDEKREQLRKSIDPCAELIEYVRRSQPTTTRRQPGGATVDQ